MMQKKNFVSDGQYKGRTVVFSNGFLWINTGFFSLLRLDSAAVRNAEVTNAVERTITVTYKDGGCSKIMLDEQLYELAVQSLHLLPAEKEKGLSENRKKSTVPSEADETGAGNEKIVTQSSHGTLRLAASLLLIGFVTALIFHLTGKF
jgi:hypothetical protein